MKRKQFLKNKKERNCAKGNEKISRILKCGIEMEIK